MCPNETELQRLVDMPTESDEQAEARRGTAAMGVPNVLVTIGKGGSVLYGLGGEPATGRLPASKVVDTTGAGDCSAPSRRASRPP